jgi:uncharacterized membrane protein
VDQQGGRAEGSIAKFPLDLVFIWGLLALSVITTYIFPVPFCSGILGSALLFFMPGYICLAALFPGRHDLRTVVRALLTIPSSIAIAILLALGLTYTAAGVTSDSIFATLVVVVLLGSAIVFYRRQKLPKTERFVLSLRSPFSKWEELSSADKIIYTLWGLSILVVFGAFAFTIVGRTVGERFTEFYILGIDGEAQEYPAERVSGEPVTGVVGVVNREQEDVQYRVERIGSAGREQMATLQLRHNETWEQPFSFALVEPGEDQKIEFLLYKEGESESYRSVHMWVTVREE